MVKQFGSLALLKTQYFVRLVALAFFVFATLKYNQTTQLDSLAIHLNTDLPEYSYSVSLLAV